MTDDQGEDLTCSHCRTVLVLAISKLAIPSPTLSVSGAKLAVRLTSLSARRNSTGALG